MSVSAACAVGRLCLFLLFCMWPQQRGKRLLHPMCCWWQWFFSLCWWGLSIRCLWQSRAHIKSYHDEGAGQSDGLCFVCLSPGINPEWPQEDWLGSLFVPVPGTGTTFPSAPHVCTQPFKQTPGSVCPDALYCFNWHVAQQMLSGQKTDGASTRGMCCSD